MDRVGGVYNGTYMITAVLSPFRRVDNKMFESESVALVSMRNDHCSRSCP